MKDFFKIESNNCQNLCIFVYLLMIILMIMMIIIIVIVITFTVIIIIIDDEVYSFEVCVCWKILQLALVSQFTTK